MSLDLSNILTQAIYSGSHYTWRDVFQGSQENSTIIEDVTISNSKLAGVYTAAKIQNNIIFLFQNVIDPIHNVFGRLTFSNCYRSPSVNSTIKGASPTSAHLTGNAIDIIGFGNIGDATKSGVTNWISANKCSYIDQVFYESTSSGGGGPYPYPGGWLHIGLGGKADGSYITRKVFANVFNHTIGSPISGLTCNGVLDGSDYNTDKQTPDNTIPIYKDLFTSPITSDNQNTINVDFQFIQANQDNVEMDNTNVTWGSRSALSEETDWIGLKQYLIYLCSLYYPQALIPFVELIPYYTLENNFNASPTSTQQDESNRNNNNLSTNQEGQSAQDFYQSTQFIDKDRYQNLTNRVNNLVSEGGTDLFTLDPFREANSKMYHHTEAEDLLRQKRGFGFKIFGSISLQPGVQDGFISKAGGVGIESLEVESGSDLTNSATIISLNIKDVQGNKFFDPNSPWSIILNGSNTTGGDFYLRYGWQLRIPDWWEKVSEENVDVNSKKFWNHPGWTLFESLQDNLGQGKTDKTKKYILSIGKMCDNTLTITQSTVEESFKTPGYLLDRSTDTFTLDRRLNPVLYMPLSMLPPDISINSEDQSVTATLRFMTQSALANLGCPISKSDYLRFLVTKSGGEILTLKDLLQAYVKDNVAWWTQPNSIKIKSELQITEQNLEDYVQVTLSESKEKITLDGGLPLIDPNTIPIEIPTSYSSKFTATNSSSDDRSSYAILKELLEFNGLTPVGFGDNTTNTGTGNIVLIYTPSQSKSSYSPKGSQIVILPNTVNANLNKNSFSRLRSFDDVFSFRFKGSLVESINIQKTEQQTEQTISSLESYATKNEIKAQDVKEKPLGQTEIEKYRREKDKDAITIDQKKRILTNLTAQISGLTVKCLCHPWITQGRLVGVKGTGFFDGLYIVTKVKHILESNNKFTSEVNGFRILNKADQRTIDANKQNAQYSSMRNPSIGVATPIANDGTSKILSANGADVVFSQGVVVTGPTDYEIAQKNAELKKDPFPRKFYLKVKDKYTSNIISPDNTITEYYNNLAATSSSDSTSWSDGFVSTMLSTTDTFGSPNLTGITSPFNGAYIISSLKSKSLIRTKDTNSNTNYVTSLGAYSYTPKQGDLIIYNQGINYHFAVCEAYNDGVISMIEAGPEQNVLRKSFRKVGDGFNGWGFYGYGIV